VPTKLPNERARDVTVSPGLIVPMGQIVRGPVLAQDGGSRRESMVVVRAPLRAMRTVQSPTASIPPFTVAL
jgi:hypothetical protein